MDIQYHCPGFLRGIDVYREFLLFRAAHPEYFYDNCIIDTIFDSFPTMTWNGGGMNMGEFLNLKEIDQVLNWYDDLNIALQLTCTNPVLEKEDTFDRYCNAIVERFISHPLNSVLVASPVLDDYLRDKYPGIKLDWSIVSTTRPENVDLNYNDFLSNYYRIVIPRIHGKDFEYLNKINPEDRHKIEILCTDPCPVTCPRLASHYEEYGHAALYQTDVVSYPCTSLDRSDLFVYKYKEDQIFYDELPKYQEMGYNRFKISGRRNAITVIHNLVLYTVKPEYQYEMVFYLLSRIGR